MNWIKENKFLFGFLLAMLVGVGALGFLLLGAKGKYDNSRTAYESKINELNGLQKRAVFPSQKNLEKLNEQKKQVTEKVSELAKALAAQQAPAEQISPTGFQDKLKAAVNALKTKATQGREPVMLGDSPERFFLGFERYETAPPDAGAAVALGRQLKVIEWVVGNLIDSGVAKINSISRPELPEEKGKQKEEEKGGKPAKHALRKNPFEISFLGDQRSFKKALNGIVEYQGQFMIPRAVVVKNTQEKVVRTAPGAFVPPPPPNPDGTPGAPVASAPVAAPSSTYIVGEEKIEVRLFLETVDFAEPAPPAAK